MALTFVTLGQVESGHHPGPRAPKDDQQVENPAHRPPTLQPLYAMYSNNPAAVHLS
jgi:hypothetical protein